jgi:hypothetical protein
MCDNDWTAGIPACLTSPFRSMSAWVLSNHDRFTPLEAAAWQAGMPAVQCVAEFADVVES